MNPPAPHEFLLPLLPDRWAYLRVPGKLTPDEWDRMMLVLEAMRPGLVVDPVERVCEFLSTALGARTWQRPRA